MRLEKRQRDSLAESRKKFAAALSGWRYDKHDKQGEIIQDEQLRSVLLKGYDDLMKAAVDFGDEGILLLPESQPDQPHKHEMAFDIEAAALLKAIEDTEAVQRFTKGDKQEQVRIAYQLWGSVIGSASKAAMGADLDFIVDEIKPLTYRSLIASNYSKGPVKPSR